MGCLDNSANGMAVRYCYFFFGFFAAFFAGFFAICLTSRLDLNYSEPGDSQGRIVKSGWRGLTSAAHYNPSSECFSTKVAKVKTNF